MKPDLQTRPKPPAAGERSLVLLSVTGRRGGRVYTFPVQYARHGDALWIYVAAGAERAWWRNLTSRAPVQVLLRGAVQEGMARASCGRGRPQQVGRGCTTTAPYPRGGSAGRVRGGRGYGRRRPPPGRPTGEAAP